MKTFEELGAKKHLKELKEMGFGEPFPIQEAAIPPLLEGKDIIGQAQTGTGKTAAFGLPILEKIDERQRETQAVIIVPTRELAMQVAGELRKFSDGAVGVTAVYGGEKMLRQIRHLRKARQIIVATPGRMLDFIRERILRLGNVKFVVLDEADRMLDMGFIDDVKEILRHLPEERQTSMFSATMPPAIVKLAHEFLKNPEKIIVSGDEISNVMVKQNFMEVHEHDKLNQLCNLLKEKKKTIVFCATKMRAKNLTYDLYRRGFDVVAIHGDMEQPQRTRVINEFKSGKADILIATDVVARGIDVPTVERVISYDVPRETLVYFHRIGRTARARESGIAIIFVSRNYRNEFDAIRRETKVQIARMETPRVLESPIVRVSEERGFRQHRRFGGRRFSGRGLRRDFRHGRHSHNDRHNRRRYGRR